MTQGPIRVLIADDEEKFRGAAKAVLERRGFMVAAVATGEEAVARVQNGNLDVVVLDLIMPGMGGEQAFHQIHALNPDLPLIVLTSHGDPDSAILGLKDGLFDYLIKPCTIELLAQKIKEAHQHKGGLAKEELKVRDIMTPLTAFNTIYEYASAAEAVHEILESYHRVGTATAIPETIHRSLLVINQGREPVGLISFADVLRALMPKPHPIDPAHHDEAPLKANDVLSGLFTIMARDLAKKTVAEIICQTRPLINADANLMEAVWMMTQLGFRRLLVQDGDRVIGVIREQDLFFEVGNIIKRYKTLR